MSEVYSLTPERKSIFESIRVPAVELKLVFVELSAIFAKTTFSKSFVLKLSNGVLSVRASTNLEYIAYLTNLSQDAKDFEVGCLFEDIKELIYGRGELRITITPTYLEIEQKESLISLVVVDYQVPTLPQIEGIGEELTTKPITDCLKILLKLAPSSSVYQKSATVLAANKIAQIRFPSVWLETDSSGLELPMEISIANIILNFLSNSDTVNLLKIPQWTAVTKGISTLFIPIKDDVNIKSIAELTKDFNYIGEFSFRGLPLEVQKLVRAMGKSDCKVYLFENSVRVEVRTNSIQYNFTTAENEKLLDSFTIRLEFLNVLLSTLGETVKVYEKGDYRCIKAAKARVLISSLG